VLVRKRERNSDLKIFLNAWDCKPLSGLLKTFDNYERCIKIYSWGASLRSNGQGIIIFKKAPWPWRK